MKIPKAQRIVFDQYVKQFLLLFSLLLFSLLTSPLFIFPLIIYPFLPPSSPSIYISPFLALFYLSATVSSSLSSIGFILDQTQTATGLPLPRLILIHKRAPSQLSSALMSTPRQAKSCGHYSWSFGLVKSWVENLNYTE